MWLELGHVTPGLYGDPVLQVTTGERLDDLSGQLGRLLSQPLRDPMAPEWIVVASAGVERWLRLEMARRLGVSAPGTGDGIAANLDLLYPGRLIRRVLDVGGDQGSDPWDVGHLTWVVLDVLAAAGADPRLGPLQELAPGATLWGRARRLADLLDRYLLHRPEMIRQWSADNDIDGSGNPLPARAAWQPHLWRLVHERIGGQSPAESRPERLAALRDGACPDEVPERVSLFGMTSIPGGVPFVEFLDALAAQRDVNVFLHQPSAVAARRVCTSVLDAPGPIIARSDDPTSGEVAHPLLRLWARPAREGLVLLGDRLRDAVVHPVVEDSERRPATLLEQVQHDLRSDRPPAGTFVLADGDTSIRIHSCHGSTRQVEVLRDQILHLLASDDTLTEDDIVVLCPALEEFAALIESVWGPSAGDRWPTAGSPPGPPALSYRLTDRSLGSAVPLLAALAALVELLDSRFSDAAVLDFVNLPPVRLRFGFDDDDLATLAEWVDTANTRWGIDGDHRARWGVPRDYDDGTWSVAIDRLLFGAMISDDANSLGPGEVLPIGVEGGGVSLAGRFADLLGRLAALAEDVRRPRPALDWVLMLQGAADTLLAAEPTAAWQSGQLSNVLQSIAAQVAIGDEACGVELTLADVRGMLGGQLQGTPGRSDFFRGGITVSSLTPLRGIPHRVVCLLGMDETAFGSAAPDGDDLTAFSPCIGDRDRRADTRQALLDAVLAAGSHLVITRMGHSVVTNQKVPPAVALAELRETISDTIDPACRTATMKGVEVVHPCQSYDERNFAPHGLSDPTFGPTGPWSFDPLACAGAQQRLRSIVPPPLLASPLTAEPATVVELGELREFLAHPAKYFLRRRLEVALPDTPNRSGGKLVAPTTSAGGVPRAAAGRNLVLELDTLEAWDIANRLLVHRRAGGDLESFERRELAANLLPPGRLSAQQLAAASGKVEPLIAALDGLGALDTTPVQRLVDVVLPNGVRLVGAVGDECAARPGPVTVTTSAWNQKRVLGPWLDLLALTAHDPQVLWHSVIVTSATTKAGFKKLELEIPVDSAEERHQRAIDALGVVIDLFQRGCREPLPLFAESSILLHEGKRPHGAWSKFRAPGEGDDVWNQVAFDHQGIDDILAVSCRADDPPGSSSSRAQRYADYLWDAFDAAVATPADPSGAEQ